MSSTDVLYWPGMRSEYSWIPPGEAPSLTGPNQVGVSFSAHGGTVYETAGRTREADIPDGSVFVTGAQAVTWLRVRETTEAVEVYLAPQLLRSAAGGEPDLEPALAVCDGMVVAVCSVLRQAHTAGVVLSDVASSTLAHRLAQHLVTHYGRPRRRAQRPRGRLAKEAVDTVAQYVDAELAGPLTLERLAKVVYLSPFHFAHAFKATTGLSPHQFVVRRRVERATALLVSVADPVEQVAAAVGFSNVSHFRRLFRRYVGVLPGELRENSKIGPALARRHGAASSNANHAIRTVEW
jgi:AraC family transcriptional regulator